MTTTAPRPGPESVRDLAGGWRRTRLILPDGSGDDSGGDSTVVTWLQSTSYYVDLRQPADRPPFDGVRCAATMSQPQRDWVASQEGFAGHLVKQGTVFNWRRDLDLQPPREFPDAGTLHYSEDVLVEEGVHQPYAEHWVALEVASTPRWGLRVTGEQDQIGLLIRVGDWFGWASGPAVNSATPTAVSGNVVEPPFAETQISLGRIHSGEWVIDRSSLPFREGATLTPRVTGSVVITSGLTADGRHTEQHWDLVSAEGEI